MPEKNTTSSTHQVSRREFLKISGLAGGGFLIGVYLAACSERPTEAPFIDPTAAVPASPSPNPTDSLDLDFTFEPSVFLKIGADNIITITVHKSEMGQGVRTTFPMLVAEELEADWNNIRVEQAPAARSFGNQVTGGSTSTFENFQPLRRAGAVAREMLLTAAAGIWGVEKETCFAENSMVYHLESDRKLTFGELAETAAELEVPLSRSVPLKDPADFKIIGTRVPRINQDEIISGRAVYGLDVKIPGMLYAVVSRSPMLGGTLESFDVAAAKSIPGVRNIFEIEEGVAVVAENTWAALQGREALNITWREGLNSDFSTDNLRADLLARANEGAAFDINDQTLQAIYEVPYFAHATMEPMNCVADVQPDRCEIWVPTQSPIQARDRVKRYIRLNDQDIHVHVTLIGGGFGRRLEVDYVGEAVQISMETGGPVQVVWTREDDIQHDFYHPFSYHLARTSLDQPGLPSVQNYTSRSGPPTGAWRSVTNIPQAYVRESFLDEMAHALAIDPLDIRRSLEQDRLQETLEVAAEKSGWGSPLPDGWGRGIACHATWDATSVAIVAEVSVDNSGRCQVHRIVCAVECGIIVNPDMVEAQMEGGIVFGLTAALKGNGITFENGRAQQGNFHDFPLFQFDEMPEVEVHILPSSRPSRGVGEMSTPPVIPAIANAVFNATGIRVRHIPISPKDLLK